MKHTLVNIGKWMLVILFLSYYISTTMFYHTHDFNWGTVTHSHPYLPSNSEAPSHTHTPVQCQTISFLSYLLLTLSFVAAFFCNIGIVKKIYIRIYSCKSLFQPVFSPLRAPPVFICK